MTMENPGHDQKIPTPDHAQPPSRATVANPSRRRFNRAGVGASAVVLTLASRSVLADTICKSPSGFDSLAPSMAAGTDPNRCSGKTASQWLSQDPWPIPKDTPFAGIFGEGYPDLFAETSSTTVAAAASSANAGKSWIEAFSINPAGNTPGNANGTNGNNGNNAGNTQVGKANSVDNGQLRLRDATLFQAMKGSKTPQVVKNLIAALLNFKADYNSFPTDTDVIRIFQGWQQNGFYEVRATVKWYEPDINKYLASVNSVG